MGLGERAYEELFGEPPQRRIELSYSGRVKDYGGLVRERIGAIEFVLSKEFREIDEEIQKGLLQQLLCKLYRVKKKTLAMDLYNSFLKKIGDYATGGGGDADDDELRESFERVSARYFDGYLLMPHLKWVGPSTSVLGRYTFATDTVTISSVLRGAGDALDYVLYHELLHKKHKFEHRGNTTRSHTTAFRNDEKRFRTSNGGDPEKALHAWLRANVRRRRAATNSRQQEEKEQKSVLRKLLDYF